MGRKNSSHASEESDIVESDEEEMEVKVEKAIKELPTLEEKVQAIAINQYLIQKRALDKEVAAEINKIEVTHRKTFEPLLEEVTSNLLRSSILFRAMLTLQMLISKEWIISWPILRNKQRITTTPKNLLKIIG